MAALSNIGQRSSCLSCLRTNNFVYTPPEGPSSGILPCELGGLCDGNGDFIRTSPPLSTRQKEEIIIDPLRSTVHTNVAKMALSYLISKEEGKKGKEKENAKNNTEVFIISSSIVHRLIEEYPAPPPENESKKEEGSGCVLS